MKIRGWVGFSDGKLYVGRLEGYDVLYSEFFRSRKAARRCYQDVRRATLIMDDPKPKGKR